MIKITLGIEGASPESIARVVFNLLGETYEPPYERVFGYAGWFIILKEKLTAEREKALLGIADMLRMKTERKEIVSSTLLWKEV